MKKVREETLESGGKVIKVIQNGKVQYRYEGRFLSKEEGERLFEKATTNGL